MGRYKRPRPKWTRRNAGDRKYWYGRPQKELKYEPEKDDEDMVTILESAKFDRKALLGEDADIAARLERPGDDYRQATYLIWLSMVKAGRRDGIEMTGNNNRAGWMVEGIGPSQVLDLLWPTLVRGEKDRARSATVRYLKDCNNAVVIEQGRLHLLPKWWVAEEWEVPVMKREGSGKARVHGDATKRKPKLKTASTGRYKTASDIAAQVDEFINDNGAAPADTFDAPIAVTDPQVAADPFKVAKTQSDLDWLAEQLNVYTNKIFERFYSSHADLMNENAELRTRLDTIRKAMQ